LEKRTLTWAKAVPIQDKLIAPKATREIGPSSGKNFVAEASVFDRLTRLLREVFDNDELVATPALTAHQVMGWDSLGNVRLFVEIEREFGIRFSATEIGSLKNVGQLAELITARGSKVTR
jgi:acyl carrier protein